MVVSGSHRVWLRSPYLQRKAPHQELINDRLWVMGALLLVCPCIDEHGRQHVFSTNTNPQVCTAVEHRAEPPNTLYLLIQLHRGSSVIQSAAESDVPAKKDKLQKFQHDESTEKPSFFSKQVCHIN